MALPVVQLAFRQRLETGSCEIGKLCVNAA